MSVQLILIMVVVAIFAAILIGYKTKMNVGMLSLGFAYVIGVFFLNMQARDIIDLWPYQVIFQMIAITGFYGYANSNDTLKVAVGYLLYPFRKIPQILPFVVCIIGLIIAAAAGAVAYISFYPLMGFTIAKRGGWPPIMFAAMSCVLGVVGSSVPFSQFGLLVVQALEKSGYTPLEAQELTWRISGTAWLFTIIFVGLLYIVLKGYKLESLDMDKPDKFNSEQKKTLAIIIIVISFLIVPSVLKVIFPGTVVAAFAMKINLDFICILGFIACAILKLGDRPKVITKKIPWDILVMLGGIYVLVSIGSKSGAIEYFASIISSNVPAFLIGPIFVLIAAAISFFTVFFTVFPIMFPLVPAIAAATGLSPVMLLACIFIGSFTTSVSPFSSGGMKVLAQCPYPDDQEKLFTQQMYAAGAICALAFILSFTGFMGILG